MLRGAIEGGSLKDTQRHWLEEVHPALTKHLAGIAPGTAAAAVVQVGAGQGLPRQRAARQRRNATDAQWHGDLGDRRRGEWRREAWRQRAIGAMWRKRSVTKEEGGRGEAEGWEGCDAARQRG